MNDSSIKLRLRFRPKNTKDTETSDASNQQQTSTSSRTAATVSKKMDQSSHNINRNSRNDDYNNQQQDWTDFTPTLITADDGNIDTNRLNVDDDDDGLMMTAVQTTTTGQLVNIEGNDIENDNADLSTTNQKDGKRKKKRTKKFATSDKSEMVKLIYGDSLNSSPESVQFSKKDITAINSSAFDDSDDNDDDYDENVLFIKDSKPLINADSKRNKLIGAKRVKFARQQSEEETSSSDHESKLALFFQVFIPFLIAGFGTVGAGLVLDVVQHWEVFQKVTEVFILVPALLGLKGNLEMTLASRLSTQANLGHMNSGRECWLMASGNMALIQCQATVVGFLAALFAIGMEWLPDGDFDIHHALLLCASSLLTASFASFLLGLVMIAVVMFSYKCSINPDNVATPIAASLGDLITLALLAQFSSLLFFTIDLRPWLSAVIMAVFLSLIPLWCYIAKNNKYTNQVLYNGWKPVICAMAISSFGGCILDFAVRKFKGIAVFNPVINGVGGNLVAVQASRISTYFHKRSKLGVLPKSDAKLCLTPFAAFFSKSLHARTARVLLMMVIPGHLLFTYGIHFLRAGHTTITPQFLVVYLAAAFVQVLLLLYFAHVMILCMWVRAIDPDNSAIPYLTAIGDLLGTALLALAFFFLFTIGDRDADVGD